MNEMLKPTPNLTAYDEAMSAAMFMKEQAMALLENAAEIEFSARKTAESYVGKQDGPLLPLRHRLMCKELGYDVSMDGPSPDIMRSE